MRTEIIAIANWLKRNFNKSDGVEAYAFGSAIRSDEKPNDIDIMILYKDPAHPQIIRDYFDVFGHLPIHLIFLTVDEEIETNFIENQNCIAITQQIGPLSSNKTKYKIEKVNAEDVIAWKEGLLDFSGVIILVNLSSFDMSYTADFNDFCIDDGE